MGPLTVAWISFPQLPYHPCKNRSLRNDNKISRQKTYCTFKIVLSWFFPRETAFLDGFPLCPQFPSLKNANLTFITVSPSLNIGCGFFAYSGKLFYLQSELFCLQWEVRLISALRGCKQRSLTVSKKNPTVSKKASPQKKQDARHKFLRHKGARADTHTHTHTHTDFCPWWW